MSNNKIAKIVSDKKEDLIGKTVLLKQSFDIKLARIIGFHNDNPIISIEFQVNIDEIEKIL